MDLDNDKDVAEAKISGKNLLIRPAHPFWPSPRMSSVRYAVKELAILVGITVFFFAYSLVVI